MTARSDVIFITDKTKLLKSALGQTEKFRNQRSKATLLRLKSPQAGNCQISKSTGRIRTTGEDPDRREGVYCFAALIVGRPFDLRDPLRFGSRWN